MGDSAGYRSSAGFFWNIPALLRVPLLRLVPWFSRFMTGGGAAGVASANLCKLRDQGASRARSVYVYISSGIHTP